MAHVPQFLAGLRIIRIQAAAGRADELLAVSAGYEHRHAVGLAMMHRELGVIERAGRLPHRLAGGGVQRDDVLHVAAVHVDDHGVTKEHRRTGRPGPGFVVAVQITPLPQHLAGGGIHTRRAVRAEVKKHAALLDDRRGRRVRVVARDSLRLGDIEQMQIMQHLAGVFIDAKAEELLPILRRRGQPYLFTVNHRRGISPIMNRRLPRDILGLRPFDRQICRRRMPIPTWPAELGPWFGPEKGRRDEQGDDHPNRLERFDGNSHEEYRDASRRVDQYAPTIFS